MNLSDSIRLKAFLSPEQLQLPAIDELINKYREWLTLTKETQEGRKTRSANRRTDQLYDEILSFQLPPIQFDEPVFHQHQILQQPQQQTKTRGNKVTKSTSVDSSLASDTTSDSSSGPITRSLRSRSRTPTAQNQRPVTRQMATPSTPQNQRIRTNLKQQTPSGQSTYSNGSSSVLTAALNQQHPTVSATKLRQLIRADSAQKKREENLERQRRLMLERKAKEERAEAQRKNIMNERALTAKIKREQRLLHAAELRQAREEAQKAQKKQAEEVKRRLQFKKREQEPTPDTDPELKPDPEPERQPKPEPTNHQEHNHEQNHEQSVIVENKPESPAQTTAFTSPEKPASSNLNSTFQKPSGDIDNIDISVHNETNDDKSSKAVVVASWARAPHLREALNAQFKVSREEQLNRVLRIYPQVALPVRLENIFGPSSAVTTKYLKRTSSAVWSPPNKPVKRTSSMVLTPQKNGDSRYN